jgi:hypothetical protein
LQFIREDLKYEDGQSDQANFHGSDDFITVQDLWQMWVHSKGMCHFQIALSCAPIQFYTVHSGIKVKAVYLLAVTGVGN